MKCINNMISQSFFKFILKKKMPQTKRKKDPKTVSNKRPSLYDNHLNSDGIILDGYIIKVFCVTNYSKCGIYQFRFY
jgi:hypothetical protein